MEKNNKTKSIVINYGLILAGILISVIVLKYILGATYSKEFYSPLISGIVFITIIALGIKKFKTENSQYLTWGEGVKIGVGIAIIAAVLTGIYQYIFTNFIEPDYINKMLEMQTEAYLDAGMDEEQIEVSIEMAKKFTNPILTIATGIIGYAIGGFIIAAIASAVMKKAPENY